MNDSKSYVSPVAAFSKDSSQIFLVLVLLFVCIAIIIYFIYRDKISLSDLSAPAFPCITCTKVPLPQTINLEISGGLSGGVVGVKRAFLIGCNYSYAGSPCIQYSCTLGGCIEDIKDISLLLTTKAGFLTSNITTLLDDGSTAFPSKSLIISTLETLITSMNSGDTTAIWFSGHGAQIANSGSEGGYNECWCPPDTINNGLFLTDDTLNAIVKKAPAGSNIFIGSDSCHSGTVFDLQYILQDPSGANSNRGLTLNSIRGRLPQKTFSSFKPNSLVRSKLLYHSRSLENSESDTSIGPNLGLSSEAREERTVNNFDVISDSFYTSTQACIICLSACQDYDTAADAYIDGEGCGAMSWAFQKCFSSGSSLTDLLVNMRKLLKKNGFTQIPQLTMGTLVNPNLVTFKQILNIS